MFNKNNIYFIFPCRGVGGVSLLFLRVSEYLARSGLANCHLVDYADGFMAKNHHESLVTMHLYEDTLSSVVIPANSIVIFQSMTPWSIYPGLEINPRARIFFWNCHPFNLIPLFPGLRRRMQSNNKFALIVLRTILRVYRNKMRKLVALMHAKRSLVFMDFTNLEATEKYLELAISNAYLVPIPATYSSNKFTISTNRNLYKSLRVTWVGRIVDFKFHALHRSLIELNQVSSKIPLDISIMVIGQGEFKTRLIHESKVLANLKFEFIDHVHPNELDELLVSNTDLLIAMGTSALEGARLGIPTLLLDVAYAPVSSSYNFKWLHDQSGFNLGNIVDFKELKHENYSMLSRILELIEDFEVISQKTKSYFERNHGLSEVSEKLLKALECAECTYGDLARARLLNRGFLYSSFLKIRRAIS